LKEQPKMFFYKCAPCAAGVVARLQLSFKQGIKIPIQTAIKISIYFTCLTCFAVLQLNRLNFYVDEA